LLKSSGTFGDSRIWFDNTVTSELIRFFFASYNPPIREMKRAQGREADQATGSRYVSTLVIAAAVIAAVRVARDDLGRPSPNIAATISESVGLARSLLEAVLRKYPRMNARGRRKALSARIHRHG
jgi:hypothetical protein